MNKNKLLAFGMICFTLLAFVPKAGASMVATGWEEAASVIAEVSDKSGVDADLLAAMGAIESTFRPKVKNRRSSARGMYQFTTRTWRVTLAQYGHLYDLDSTANRFDPYANTAMAAEYIKENVRVMSKKLRREPTREEIYMAHLISPLRTVAVSQMPNRVKLALVYPRLARYNFNLFYNKDGSSKTVRQFKLLIRSKIKMAMNTYGDLAIAAVHQYRTNVNNKIFNEYKQSMEKDWLCSSNALVREWGGELKGVSESLLRTINEQRAITLGSSLINGRGGRHGTFIEMRCIDALPDRRWLV